MLGGGHRGAAPRYLDYWGKADADDGASSGAPFHLAPLHMLDVAAVAERRVSRSPVLREKLAHAHFLALPPGRVASTVAAFVALHDIGKLDVRFQLKAPEAAFTLNPRRRECRFRGPYDHGAWGFAQRDDLRDVLETAWGAWESIVPLLQAVTGHHGRLPTRGEPLGDEDIEAFVDEDRTARRELARDMAALFTLRGAELPWQGKPGFPLVALLAGLCSVADWIGSQVDYFGYVAERPDLAGYYAGALDKAERALDALHLDATPSGKSFVELFRSEERPDITPRAVQVLTEALAVEPGPCLVVVEAVMGSGKTEAALSLASRLVQQGAGSGLFVALPTMATSNSLFDRVERYAERAYTGGTVNLELAHSRARGNEAFRRLWEPSGAPSGRHYDGARAQDREGDEEATAVCAKWYRSSKRALISQIGVGTVDQAMLAALRVRHFFVRLYGLATSVVVLDEIHAYDAYMSVVLERLVEWLGALRTPVILLSATLPAETRRTFERAYRKGAFGDTPTLPPQANDRAYPLVSFIDKAGPDGRRTYTLPEAPVSYALDVEIVRTPEPDADVLPRLVEASKRGRVAWIRNTVKEAQQAYESACNLGASAMLFHARFRGCDRKRIERGVLKGFGRDGAHERGLVIATQVIEQSLDLDFDLMASDLAPIDLLLQRAGRLHRHLERRPRPAGFARRLLVVTPPEQDVASLSFGPSGRIYDPVTLWLADDSLGRHPDLHVPADLRELIEDSYDSQRRVDRIARAAPCSLLEEAERKRIGRLETDRAKANEVCIPPTPDAPRRDRLVEDDDQDLQALTRLGPRSVSLLPVLWDMYEGVATTLDGEALVLDPEAPSAWREMELLAEQTVSVPFYRVKVEATAKGEQAEYIAWRERLHRFCSEMHAGTVLVVPMSRRGADFKGPALGDHGLPLHVYYAMDRGLYFDPPATDSRESL